MMTQVPLVLPRPKKLSANGEFLDVSKGIKLIHGAPVFQSEALRGLLGTIASPAGEIEISFVWRQDKTAEAYDLSVTKAGIEIRYAAEAGAYYALLTLKQLVRQAQGGKLACIEIEDEPDFPNRGIMMDVSRNRIPTLITLKKVVDVLSALKINQFQLYFEGKSFLYPSFADVYVKDADVLTSSELKELDGYCKERFIDFVPNQNCFGHMSEWLDCKAFNHLAECPEGFDYYGTKMPPSTLNPLLEESFDFVAKQFADLLPLFSSYKVNIGGDEPFELGCGASETECKERGRGAVYFDFMKKVFSEMEKYGKSPMMWGDVFKEHYEECKDILPKDVTVLEWGYNHDSYTDEICALYENAGARYYLCPGTSLWNTVTGKTENMLGNVKSAARLGKNHGAEGLLMVDWGDGGTCQPLSCSLWCYAVGAAYSWNGEAEQDDDIASYLSVFVFEDETNLIGELLFELGGYYQCAEKDDFNATKIFKVLYVQQTDCMNLFEGNYEPLFANRDFVYLKAEEYERTESYLCDWKARFEKVNLHASDGALYRKELQWAVDYLIHGCRLGALKASAKQFTKEDIRMLKEDIMTLNKKYEEVWAQRNKRTGLKQSMMRMRALQRKYAAILGEE